MKKIRLQVNGTWRSGWAAPGQTLLEFLRTELDCTEVKHGCGKGDCGACTVILNGMAVDSCLVLSLQVDGSAVVTAKGLGTKENPHPLQKAFIETGAFQCGFCTPGMILSAKALLDTNPQPTKAEIRRGLSGNLCRCTGYRKIEEAVTAAVDYSSKNHGSTEDSTH
ncbi:MAG: (2Fe-2S)-binding protein [Coprothermobacterota bacterium]|nr:(2Fe-2S)-binding protein [Coprothermobacterota bacterium]